MRPTRDLAVLCLVLLASAPVPAATGADLPATAVAADRLAALDDVPVVDAPSLDVRALLTEDAQREAIGQPPRFAVPTPVSITPEREGRWETIGGGEEVWRLRVRAEGAVSLNLGFGRYVMPEGGRLHVFSPDLERRVRPFTAADNAAHGELWTPIVPGDELVIEVVVPGKARPDLALELSSINVGYRDFGDTSATRSGSCNVDVVCPAGDEWRGEIPSVAAISTGGSIFCTGFMVNNTARDQTPYFMTANHCGITSGNAASLVTYWNFETTSCDGTPNGSLDDFQTGAFWRASYSPSDFTLVELDEAPDPAFLVTFAGWDRSGDDAQQAIAIHHPSGDEKRISFEYDPTTTTSYLANAVPGDGTHVRVTDWDLGTTEPGSSGSPLFNQDHQVIGQLHGGYASCTSQTSDWYGKFSVSWTGGGTASSRLSDWLDPIGSGETEIGTLGGGPVVLYTGHSLDDSAGNGDGILDPGESVVLAITARNVGSAGATAVQGSLSSPSGAVAIDDGDGTWPNLAEQQSAQSDAPHFAVTVAGDAICGDSIPFDLEFLANEDPGMWTSSFSIPLGVEGAESVRYADDMESGVNGWQTAEPSGSNPWVQTTSLSNSPTHSWFADDIASVSDSTLTMPIVTALPANAKLRFAHYVASESGFDGGVLEYAVGGGAWTDAGSLIVAGGYNATISTSYSSPIGGRSAWAGSLGWVDTELDLASLAGQDVAFRWRFATDSSVSADGWYVDDVEVVSSEWLCSPVSPAPPGEASNPAGPGAPFRIDPDGAGWMLSWSAPIAGGPVDDYVLYSMPLADVASGAACEGALGSSTFAAMGSLPDDSAFVVVARNAAGEGSYGEASAGERAYPAAVCP